MVTWSFELKIMGNIVLDNNLKVEENYFLTVYRIQ